MATRVTATEVKEIISTTLSDSIVNTFINAANYTVTELIGNNSDLSDNQKKEIERWLAAHLIACAREPQPQSEGVGEARISYQGKTAMGLQATLYGQQAMLLDTTGTLSERLGRRRAMIKAVTSPERTDWSPDNA
jgi:hypothetical protein